MMVSAKSNKMFFVAAFFICLMLDAFSMNFVYANEAKLIKINDLIDQANNLDGQAVIIQGEVVGDVMPRGKFVWFNIQDTSGVMGVWAPGKLAEQILVTGDYEYHGDTVEVAGIFSRADRELNGEICVRAETVDRLEQGGKTPHLFGPTKVKIALALSILCATLLVLRMSIQRQR